MSNNALLYHITNETIICYFRLIFKKDVSSWRHPSEINSQHASCVVSVVDLKAEDSGEWTCLVKESVRPERP